MWPCFYVRRSLRICVYALTEQKGYLKKPPPDQTPQKKQIIMMQPAILSRVLFIIKFLKFKVKWGPVNWRRNNFRINYVVKERAKAIKQATGRWGKNNMREKNYTSEVKSFLGSRFSESFACIQRSKEGWNKKKSNTVVKKNKKKRTPKELIKDTIQIKLWHS